MHTGNWVPVTMAMVMLNIHPYLTHKNRHINNTNNQDESCTLPLGSCKTSKTETALRWVFPVVLFNFIYSASSLWDQQDSQRHLSNKLRQMRHFKCISVSFFLHLNYIQPSSGLAGKYLPLKAAITFIKVVMRFYLRTIWILCSSWHTHTHIQWRPAKYVMIANSC